MKTRALTAPGGRGSLYLDESPRLKKNRDYQERFKLTFHTDADASGFKVFWQPVYASRQSTTDAYPKPAPSNPPATTSLRKCMPSRIREHAMLAAQNNSSARMAG